MDPSGKWCLAVDLGADKVYVYSSLLVPHPLLDISMKSGSGPRHLAFHPNGKFMYVISELDNTVTSLSWDP